MWYVFKEKKYLRSLLNNSNYSEILKANVGQNFDASNPRMPTGLCDFCRKKHFSAFSIPQYLQFVVAPENLSTPCICAIGMKVKPSGKSSGLKPGNIIPHPGVGRPKFSPDIQKK